LTDAELLAALREHAYLEGDFLLRSGKRSRYYLDKFRFETRPDTLAALGERIAEEVREHAGDVDRLAAPQLGAIVLAAAASLASGMPFLIVRDAPKGYGTMNRIEGAFEPGESVCLLEDVVTTGGALLDAVDAIHAAGLTVETAICVIDREEGGVDALARRGVVLRPLFTTADLLRKTPAKPHG
jgi:orotate phosphoribosyltransferase